MSEDAQPAAPSVKKFGRDRYKPGAYSLDLSSVVDIPLKVNGEPSTFAEAYDKLKGAQVGKRLTFGRYKYAAETGDIELECDWTISSIMDKLVDLNRRGIDAYAVTWFYFGHDWSIDRDQSYSFFAVHQGKIVDEDCHFNAEEPLVLLQKKDDKPIWHTEPLLDAAWERYCYRKFYTETVTGQLMVLRPDEPILYNFERPQPEGHDSLRNAGLITLLKVYDLLWVVASLLVAIAFPSLRLYAAAFALLLTLKVLLRIWASRKFFQ